ncbi:MAG: hypothetical protein HY986_20985 [Candidatus Melainabacteria bacterium]|nr:hypothetical protein [Candidatus Melainabacteria bacterium]
MRIELIFAMVVALGAGTAPKADSFLWVDPEVLEERSFEDTGSKFYILSKLPYGPRTLTLLINRNGIPQLRFSHTIKPLTRIPTELAEALLAEKAVGGFITSRLFAWDGKESKQFTIRGKLVNSALSAYQVSGEGISTTQFQETEDAILR